MIINHIITMAIERRWLVIALTTLFVFYGIYHAQKLPIDAVPDITNVQVQINTKATGYSPLESEQRITYIVENSMAGIPNLDYTRSLSRYGLSQVTVIFNEGTDIYWARQQISQRLQSISDDLPPGLKPKMGPLASGLGEIYTYAVRADNQAKREDGKKYTAEDLRTIQDWIIKPQLIKVKGITEINSVGGYNREYQVAPIPGKLLAYKVTVQDIYRTLTHNNHNTGAGYIERNGEQWLIRSPGQLNNIDDIERLVVVKRDDAPVRIKDLANVSLGKELRTGAATLNGKETVLGTAMMLYGENARTVSKAIDKKLFEINTSLPKGINAIPLYNRTTLVDKTLNTVKTNLFEGALLVIIVLFILLGNIRAALIAALVIPLSMLFAMTGMSINRVSGNLMSLGAIDFGIIVDGSVIVVENALRRLGIAQHQNGRLLSLEERLTVVKASTLEVLQPTVFGVMIIMLVFLPIFSLSGVEGKMFHPMAFTLIAALLGALIFSITFVPAAIAIFVKGKIKESNDGWMTKLQNQYSRGLDFSIRNKASLFMMSILLIAACLWQGTKLGSEFLPKLDEHDIAMHALRIPGTSLTLSLEMQTLLESEINSMPEIQAVFSKIGTPEIATDPMPPNVADTFLILKPKHQWPNPNKTKAQFLSELREVVERIPGNNYEFTQPIEMRFNELIAGVRSDVAIRVYGDDFNVLVKQAENITSLLSQVKGAKDVRMEQATGLPLISIIPQRDHLALLGLNITDVQRAITTAVNGDEAGLIYQGDKRFKIVIRMHPEDTQDPELLAQLLLYIPNDINPELNYVPLGEVADIVETLGPNQINRQFGKRNIVVTANVQDQDLGSFIRETQNLLNSKLILPSGYWLEYGGTFEQLQSASQRLSIIIPLTLLIILGLLYSAFHSIKDALIIFTAIPLALTGGILALTVRGMPLSISAAVGFIALSGVAILNGVVMLSFIKELRDQGSSLLEAIYQGTQQRLRPVLMTALVASLGFIPMAFNTGTGAEIQRPLATVVIGGILSSTVLTLFLLPTLYLWANNKDSGIHR